MIGLLLIFLQWLEIRMLPFGSMNCSMIFYFFILRHLSLTVEHKMSISATFLRAGMSSEVNVVSFVDNFTFSEATESQDAFNLLLLQSKAAATTERNIQTGTGEDIHVIVSWFDHELVLWQLQRQEVNVWFTAVFVKSLSLSPPVSETAFALVLVLACFMRSNKHRLICELLKLNFVSWLYRLTLLSHPSNMLSLAVYPLLLSTIFSFFFLVWWINSLWEIKIRDVIMGVKIPQFSRVVWTEGSNVFIVNVI